jgi:hypothetical protein
MPRRPPVSVNADSAIHWPGSYEHCLRVTCEQAGDPFFAISVEAAEIPSLLALHDADEAEMVDALVEALRGAPVYCQGWQLPNDVPGEWFNRFSRDCVQCFTVYPTDVIEHRPHSTNREG